MEQELYIFPFSFQTLPPGIGLLRKLETLNADENYIEFLPDEVSFNFQDIIIKNGQMIGLEYNT